MLGAAARVPRHMWRWPRAPSLRIFGLYRSMGSPTDESPAVVRFTRNDIGGEKSNPLRVRSTLCNMIWSHCNAIRLEL